MFETVIVPLDGSAHAELAVAYGRDEAARHGARIVLIHVLPRTEPPPTPIDRGAAGWGATAPPPAPPAWLPVLVDEARQEWFAYLADVCERYALPENACAVVAIGEPARLILEEARKHPHPLIVLTTGDVAGAARPPLSELAYRLMVAGVAPVLALREPAPQTQALAQLRPVSPRARLRSLS